jgi:hydrogenase-4 component F
MLSVLVLAVPALTGAVVLACGWRRWTTGVMSASGVGVVGLGVALATRASGHHVVTSLGGAVRVDALSAFMVIVIGVVALLAATQTSRALGEVAGRLAARRARLYAVLFQVFVTCMLAAVVAANLGVLWVAVEATTIATTFLVGHRRTPRALEASWKYVVLCSVGIALAFLGTVLVYFAALHGPAGAHAASLDWTSLMAHARHLNPSVMRLAMALLLVGYGTKVGLAPLHSWLPDAHGEAPAPVSALMSGVLLTVAFYALLRFKAIADAALGPSFPRALFLVAGITSLVVAASLIIAQRDYKRLLAYSSVEHMGLLALGAAAGTPLALAAVLLHVLGHGITKSVLFLTSGEIHHAEGTTEISRVRALVARRPALGGLFGVGLLALLGFPPFSLFLSEFNMARAEVDAGLWWAVAISLACLSVIFASLASHARTLLLGSSPEAAVATPRSVVAPLAVGLGACAALGVIAWPLQALLHAAAHVVAS